VVQVFGDFPNVGEVTTETNRAREDGDRETGHGLIGFQGDAQERQQGGDQAAGECTDQNRHGDREPGASADVQARPRTGDSTDEHRSLDAEIEHSTSFGQDATECRVEERCAVEDGRRDDDDEDVGVHAATAPARLRFARTRYLMRISPATAVNKMSPCKVPTNPLGKSGPCKA